MTNLQRVLEQIDLQPPNGNFFEYQQQTEILAGLAEHLVEFGETLRRAADYRRSCELQATHPLPPPPAELALPVEALPAPAPPSEPTLTVTHYPREEPTFWTEREPVPDDEWHRLVDYEKDLFSYEFFGPVGRLELKAMICQLRRSSVVLGGHPETRDLVQMLWEGVDEIRSRLFCGHYLPPRDSAYQLEDPQEWDRLAELYDRLALAHTALEWYGDHATELKPAEATELLQDAAGAHLQIHRFFCWHWPDHQGDDQVHTFHATLRQLAHQHHVHVPWLSGRATDAELEDRLFRIVEHLKRNQEAVERRFRQEEALLQLAELLGSSPADGWTGTDARERLLQCCREVMESGVPPTYPPLRDSLIPFADLLATEPRLARLAHAVEDAQLKREQASLSGKSRKHGKRGSKAAPLNDSQFCEIRQVRELTTGKKLVILGGDPRREQSRSLQTALQLEEVLWPKMSVHSHAQDYESAIRKGDLVVVL
ncbi:MAG TPA: hypothetical protein VK689_06950, partial [Armatimonadota bacterium]|nr:hypothetical protein [Armatimonadota bacterium]